MKTHRFLRPMLTCLVGILLAQTLNAQCPTGLSPINVSSSGSDVTLDATPLPTTTFFLPHITTWVITGSLGTSTAVTTETSPALGHSYTFTGLAPDTYSICIEYIPTQSGCPSYTNCTYVTVNPTVTPCATSFSYTTDSACVTSLTNLSSGNITSSFWAIVDPTNATTTYTTQNVTVNIPSYFSAYLTNRTNNIICGQASQTITVNCPTTVNCNALFSVSSTSVCDTKNFTNSSTAGSGAYFLWDFGDGTTSNMSLNTTFAHGYPNVIANYVVVLSVYSSSTNPVPCSTYSQNVSVNCTGMTCQAGFFTSQGTGCNDKLFSNYSMGSITHSEWDFGDGTSTTTTGLSGVSHTYPNISASYLATLSVYNSTTSATPCSVSTQTINVYCNNCAVTSSITIFADTANAGNYFCYNQSTGNGTLSYLWDFGDGSSSTQQYPFHQYAMPGNYPVCLTTTNTNGTVTCSDIDCDSSSVQRMTSGFLMSSLNVIPQTTTGIKNISSTISLKTYPNPMGDVLTVELTLVNETNYTLVLVDAIGREVAKKDIKNNLTELNTGYLQKGYYTLQLINEKGIVVKTTKLIK